MPWPPTAPSTGFVSKGVTTIVWGTDGVVPPAFTYIVKSVRNSQRVEEAKVENGTGLTATEILLIDGQDYEITVVDDTTISPPVAGQVITLVVPIFGTTSNNFQFEVINNSYNMARKQDAERVLLCRSFVLFPNFTQLSPPAITPSA